MLTDVTIVRKINADVNEILKSKKVTDKFVAQEPNPI
jgi:hypothetical protein